MDRTVRRSWQGTNAEAFPAGGGVAAPRCPLHHAMKQLAHAAVSQHILYEQGECLPRPDLMAALERWTRLHTLIRTRICPASREAPPEAGDLDAALALLPDDASLRLLLGRCATRDPGDACPLERAPQPDVFAEGTHQSGSPLPAVS